MSSGLTCFLVHQILLARCSILQFPRPWDFLACDPDCRYSVDDVPRTRAALTQKYSSKILERTGILERDASGDLRLKPEVCNPAGAVIGLRPSPKNWPHALVTARGCLPVNERSIATALADGKIAAAVRETGLLFLPFRILEVALLRTLGLPATLCPRFRSWTADQLQALNQEFGGEVVAQPADRCSRPASDERPAPAGPEVAPGAREFKRVIPELLVWGEHLQAKPLLVLLGWAPMSVADQPSPLLGSVTAYLATVRRFLGLDLAGVVVWRPSAAHLDNLRFRLTWKNVGLIRELLLESADDLRDFEQFAVPGADQEIALSEMNYIVAQGALCAELAGNRAHGQLSHRVQAAVRTYEAIVRRDLITPLQEWALEHEHPIIQNAGIQLATTCDMLHQMTPMLHELLACHLERAGPADLELIPPKLLGQYLQLSHRLGSLIRDLAQARRL